MGWVFIEILRLHRDYLLFVVEGSCTLNTAGAFDRAGLSDLYGYPMDVNSLILVIMVVMMVVEQSVYRTWTEQCVLASVGDALGVSFVQVH